MALDGLLEIGKVKRCVAGDKRCGENFKDWQRLTVELVLVFRSQNGNSLHDEMLGRVFGRVDFAGADVCVQGVADLIVAFLIENAQIPPYLPEVAVEMNCATKGIQRVSELADLKIENSN